MPLPVILRGKITIAEGNGRRTAPPLQRDRIIALTHRHIPCIITLTS